MLNKLIAGLLFIFAFNSFATDYLVVSDNQTKRDLIASKYQVVYKMGRVLVVNVISVPPEFMNDLREVDLKDVSVTEYTAKRDITLKDTTKEELKKISVDRFRETVKTLIAFDGRYVGTEGNKLAADWFVKSFKDLGLDAEKQCFSSYWGRSGCNVVATKSARSYTKDTVVLVGHFDTVRTTKAGADDNTSGSAGLIELATVLKGISLPFNIKFVAADAEEIGIVGSEEYAKKLDKNGETKNVLFAINLDMIGYNKSDILAIETDKKFMTDAKLLASIISSISKYTPQINTPAWGSDHVSFIKRGVPTVMPVQDWENHNPCYHKMCDTIDKVDFDFALAILKSSLAFILEKQ